MSDTKKSLEISQIDEKQVQNEKKETIINIGEIPSVDALSKTPINSDTVISKDIEENDKTTGKEIIYSIEYESRDNVLVKEDEVEQKGAVVESVNKQRNNHDVWVQFQGLLEVKGNVRSDHERRLGRRGGQDVVNFQQGGQQQQQQGNWGGGAGGGVPMDEPESRNGFIFRVFAILLVMLILTLLYNVFVLTSIPLVEFYLLFRLPLLFLSVGILIGMSYVMMCCLEHVRKCPFNGLVLFIVLAATSNLVAASTIIVKTHIISIALAATIVTVIVCLLLALSKFDFTSFFLYVVVAMVVVTVLSILLLIASKIFNMRFPIMHTVLLYVGTLLQMALLVMELQMVIGGKKMEIGTEDYVLGAYLLYTSIVSLFLDLVKIIAGFDD